MSSTAARARSWARRAEPPPPHTSPALHAPSPAGSPPSSLRHPRCRPPSARAGTSMRPPRMGAAVAFIGASPEAGCANAGSATQKRLPSPRPRCARRCGRHGLPPARGQRRVRAPARPAHALGCAPLGRTCRTPGPASRATSRCLGPSPWPRPAGRVVRSPSGLGLPAASRARRC